VDLGALGDAATRLVPGGGDVVTLDDEDLGVVVGQRAGGEEAGEAAPEDDGAVDAG